MFNPFKAFTTCILSLDSVTLLRQKQPQDNNSIFRFNLQLFWERKLSGLNAFDIAEELVKSMDLPQGLQSENNHKI